MKTDELQAGPELDALVACKVMGWRQDFRCPVMDFNPPIVPYLRPDGSSCDSSGVPPYSTDIAAAWQVIESVMAANARTRWNLSALHGLDGWWTAYIGPFSEKARTAPLAICRAALLAVGVTE